MIRFVGASLLTLFCWSCELTAPAQALTAAAQRQLGLTYRQQERYPEAIAAFKQAIALEPAHLAGRVNLGWTLHQAKQDLAAAATLNETLSFNPFYVPALNALGIVHLVQGDLASAVRTHTWALLLQPQNEIAAYNLSLALERLQDYAIAVTMAQRSTQLEPTNPHPWVAMALAQWGLGDRIAAQRAYRQALAVDSRYSEPAFLSYLNEAGFSAGQIQRSQQILASLRP